MSGKIHISSSFQDFKENMSETSGELSDFDISVPDVRTESEWEPNSNDFDSDDSVRKSQIANLEKLWPFNERWSNN